jgi:catechol 2,3-dioxygenase-like lactoylglutathione lyase family enzyme
MAAAKRRPAPRAAKPKSRRARPSAPVKKKAAARARALRGRERRHTPETLRLRSVTPGFTVDDLDKSIQFYTDVLGFMVSERWTDGDVLRGVMLKAGVCELGLSQDDWKKGRDRRKGEGVRVWCETQQDIDGLAAQIKQAGFALTEEPKDQPWGGRAFSLDDPSGFHLTFFRES